MEANIKKILREDKIIVSATEPTGSDRKKVWLQHSKNLLKPQALKTTTTNGMTFTPIYDDNGALLYINVNGTATANTTYVIAKNTTSLKIPNESFIVNGCPSGGSTSTYGLILTNNVTPYDWDTGNGSTYPANYGTILQIYIALGVTVSNLKFKPMLRLATNTNSDYEPYVEPKIYVLNDNNIYEEFVQKHEKILYENSNGTNENITLSDSVANYNRLKIYYFNTDGVKNSIELEKPNGSLPSLIAVTPSADTIYYKYSRYTISETNMKLIRFGEVTMTTANSFDSSINKIYVTKVIGYR